MTYGSPFIWEGFELLTDDTLPPDYIKFLSGGEARVFRLDFERETGREVARWLESDADVMQQDGRPTGDAG